jgi:c-di-GMP-binding flagellar brake protein YcgR
VSGPVGRDARRYARVALELSVVVQQASNDASNDPGPETAKGTARETADRVPGGGIRFDAANVSTGGAFLRTDLLLEVGELLTLQFQLSQGGHSICTEGRVTRVSRGHAKEVAGMGVEFVDLQPDDRAAIEARLRQ